MEKTDSQAKIEAFLEDTLGYAGVREIMRQDHPGSPRLQSKLNGTVIGTFKKTNYKTTEDRASLKERAFRRTFQVAPHIYQSSEFEEQTRKKWYLRDKRSHLQGIPEGIQSRNYFLTHCGAFMKMKQTDVQSWLDQVHEQFPGAEKVFESPTSNFHGILRQPDFYLHVGGQRQRDQGKVFVAAFE